MAGQAQVAAMSAQSIQPNVRWKTDKAGGGLYPDLKPASRGPEVLDLQIAINKQRVVQGKVLIKEDGVFGKSTQEAVKEYQRDHNERLSGTDDPKVLLNTDGIVGPATWKLLGVPGRTQESYEEEGVKVIQNARQSGVQLDQGIAGFVKSVDTGNMKAEVSMDSLGSDNIERKRGNVLASDDHKSLEGLIDLKPNIPKPED